MGLEITVINDGTIVGWIASAVREGEIYMTDVQSMVDNVIAATRLYLRVCAPGQAEYELISRLNILDHGNSDGIHIGDDWISMQNIEKFAPNLGRLRGHFEKNGLGPLEESASFCRKSALNLRNQYPFLNYRAEKLKFCSIWLLAEATKRSDESSTSAKAP
jgi:hypothetical protein